MSDHVVSESNDELDTLSIIDPEAGRPAADVSGGGGNPALEDSMTAVDFTTLSDAQVRDLESGDPEQIARALNVAPGEVEPPTRISLRSITDPEERRALADATRMVRDGKYPNLKTALVEALGLEALPGNKEEAHEQASGNAAELDARGMEEKLAALEEERRLARNEFEYEKAEALLDQITELKLDLRDARKAEEQESQVTQDWQRGEEASRELAVQLYPEMGDPNSALYQSVEDEIILAEYKKDAIFNAPDWPEKIATRVYAKQGKMSGGGQAEPGENQSSSKIPRPPVKGVRMPGSPVGPAANTAVVTAQGALAQLSQLSLEEQDAVLALLDINERARARPNRQPY